MDEDEWLINKEVSDFDARNPKVRRHCLSLENQAWSACLKLHMAFFNLQSMPRIVWKQGFCFMLTSSIKLSLRNALLTSIFLMSHNWEREQD